MNTTRISLLVGTALLASTASPALASIDQYRAEASSEVRVNLEVCSAETQLAVRGDTGTDLDFRVFDSSGTLLHTDEGIDDYLSYVIAKDADGCATYGLAVNNLGEEGNDFTVVLEPITESSTRVQKYIVLANETQTMSFKACGTSAQVSARGDGDTDLDFILRNSDGAVVHENADTTDITSATLSGLLSDCETFELEVSNLGNVYNAMMLVVEPEGADTAPFAGTAPSTSLALQSGSNSFASSSGAGEYRADANSSISVSLPICGMTRLEVRGDGDTDLDFTVRDSGGTTAHSDFDLSDVTFATLEPNGECETFTLEVDNLGDVYNIFSVALVDPATLGGTSGAGEYRVNANASTKVALRVCEATRVSATGDGDTDLDFDITDSTGETVHSDYDLTDRTSFDLRPGNGGCADYQMAVSNLGDVYNMLTVTFSGDGPNSAPLTAGVDNIRPNNAMARPGPPIITVPTDNASTDGNNRNIAILNQTGEELTFIYWSNSATLDWGADRLGENYTLARDQQWNVNVNDGSNACLFDFRAITENAREIEMTRVNVCEEVSVSFE